MQHHSRNQRALHFFDLPPELFTQISGIRKNKHIRQWFNVSLRTRELMILSIKDLYTDSDDIDDTIVQKLVNIKELHLAQGAVITDKGLRHLTKLTSLRFGGLMEEVTDEGLKRLTTLTSLFIEAKNKHITSTGIKPLINLKTLVVDCYNCCCTDKAIECMTNLTILGLPEVTSDYVTDSGLKHLTNLKILHLGENMLVTGQGLSHLTNLTRLITLNEGITFNMLEKTLTNLKVFICDYDDDRYTNCMDF